MFEYHPQAIVEATEAYDWYQSRSKAAADSFWYSLRRARISVSEYPTIWPPHIAGTRRCPISNFPFCLIYIELEDVIIGLAVAHNKRHPDYWKERLER